MHGEFPENSSINIACMLQLNLVTPLARFFTLVFDSAAEARVVDAAKQVT